MTSAKPMRRSNQMSYKANREQMKMNDSCFGKATVATHNVDPSLQQLICKETRPLGLILVFF